MVAVFVAPEYDDEPLESENVLTPALVRMAIVAGVGGLLFGFDTGVVSGVLLVIGNDLGGTQLSTGQQEWIVSSALLGAFAASFAASRLADRVGRKRTILLADAFFTVGALMQALTSTFGVFLAGRVLIGAGVGLASMVTPLYLAEVAPPRYRGRIVGSLISLITFGQLLAYLVDAIFFRVSHGWRWMTGLGAAPAVLQLALMATLPESPRWLVARSYYDDARTALRTIHAGIADDRVEAIIGGMAHSERVAFTGRHAFSGRDTFAGQDLFGPRSSDDSAHDPLDEPLPSAALGVTPEPPASYLKTLRRVLSDTTSARALLLACGLQFFQQATGFNTCMYYSGKLLERAHFENPALFAIAIALANFIFTLVALRLIDTTGRRALLLRSIPGMAFGMFCLALSFYFVDAFEESRSLWTHILNYFTGLFSSVPDETNAAIWAWACLVSITLFTCSYAVGLGAAPWVVQSEVFDQDLRAVGTGLASATNWITNLVVSSTFLSLAEAISVPLTFLIYGIIAVSAWVFVYVLLPETKGLPLEEVRKILLHQHSLRGLFTTDPAFSALVVDDIDPDAAIEDRHETVVFDAHDEDEDEQR